MNLRFTRMARQPAAAMLLLAVIATGIIFRPAVVRADVGNTPKIAETSSGGLQFEANRGQFPADVRYFARSAGANLFLTATEAVYVMKPAPCGADKSDGCDNVQAVSKTAFALRMKIDGANPESLHSGEAESEYRTNHLKGSEADWVTDVPNFGRVRFDGVYDGISMIWHGLEAGASRYDFEVAPGADPKLIQLRFDGTESMAIDAAGNLVIETPAGPIINRKPVTFQEINGERIEVASSFRIEDETVRFELGEYDVSRKLTIDPTVTINNLAFSTLIGSFGDDISNDIAVDSNGNSYITGRTVSPAYPTTSGTFDTSANGIEDVFVTKFNANGGGLAFSTFIGGIGYDEGNGIAVDANGDIYVAGTAGGAFPSTAGSYDPTFNGGADVFILKMSASGGSLIYSTFIGASQIDFAKDLAIDSTGNAYVIVRTSDAPIDYPTTPGAFDTTFNGIDDVAVSKINSTGTTLLYSTFLGGSAIDNGESITVNGAGEVYVAGSTTDDVTDFPTTPGSFDTTANGITDFFVTRLNSAGSGLIFSTLIGGAGIDNANAVAIDGVGNAYVTGTASAGFPLTAGAFDTTHGGSNEVAVSKISADGSTLAYSTYLGGTQGEVGNAIAVDNFGNAHVAGGNFGGDYPTTAGAYDTTANGLNDVFFTIVNQNGSGLIYSTYLGGGGNDDGNEIALDRSGNVYITGRTIAAGSAFPTNSEAFQTFNAGANDAFITKFGDFSIAGRVIDASTGNPVSNVMVALSGQVSGFVITGIDGRFGFLDTVPGEPHSISATRPGYSINPSVFNISSLANNRELIFVAAVGSPTGGSGGTLRFENVSYSKSENGGSVTVDVKRVGEVQTTDPVTVDFTTVAATASAGSDFVPTSGTLTFNALEMSKSVTIPIINDGILEPKETFSIAISNPTNNADIETNRGSTSIQILDEDLGAGDLLISEFRQRGRLGARDEYVKLFNPNDFDVTIQTSDGSAGLTLVQDAGNGAVPISVIPNFVTIGARGHYLLTNNDPNGGFSLIGYPTGRGTTTAVGDLTFTTDLADNAALALVKSNAAGSFTPANSVDAVAFGESVWSEGKGLAPINGLNSEMSFVRRLIPGGVRDTGNNLADFLIVDNHASVFEGLGQIKVLTTLGSPAPETTESLRALGAGMLSITETGSESYDPTPVENGRQGTLTVYRTLTNTSNAPMTALRLRAVEFPTLGSELSRRYSSRPDFRLSSSVNEGNAVFASRLVAADLQPNGGGLNSTLAIDAVSALDPLMPGESIVVAIRFTVQRYGRHPMMFAAEGDY